MIYNCSALASSNVETELEGQVAHAVLGGAFGVLEVQLSQRAFEVGVSLLCHDFQFTASFLHPSRAFLTGPRHDPGHWALVWHKVSIKI
jgi:hypothetical protein